MTYTPHTEADIRRMLDVIGVASIDDLFADIPTHLRVGPLDLPPALCEFEATRAMETLAGRNRSVRQWASYLGGGAYEHFIPATVPALALRGEFATAYTPYQAEASQGTLQAVYEFQSMLCALTELEVSNASMYDGASALAEAALMAMRGAGRSTFLVPQSLNPRYRDTLITYTHSVGARFIEVPLAAEGGVTDVELWSSQAAEHSNDLAGVIIPVTNTLGACEPWEALAEVGRRHGALVIAVANPMAFSVLRGPGSWGADVCVGEAQSLGLPLSWGGPYCGFMTAKAEHVRRMPGRIVGCSVDSRGQRAFTLTLQTREQHIRREKATSNICTNQGLMALQVCIYLAMVGRVGFRRIGLANLERAALLRQMLLEVDGVEPVTGDDFFNEFTVKLPISAKAALDHLRHGGILGGISFLQPNWLTICVTETKAEPHLLAYVQQVRAAILGSRPVLVR